MGTQRLSSWGQWHHGTSLDISCLQAAWLIVKFGIYNWNLTPFHPNLVVLGFLDFILNCSSLLIHWFEDSILPFCRFETSIHCCCWWDICALCCYLTVIAGCSCKRCDGGWIGAPPNETFCFHWHAIQLSLSPGISLYPTVDELAGFCLFVCKQTSVCLFAHIHKCAYHCLMYPAAIHIFVSAAWLMVCCRYDSPLPRPPQHCCPSGCCGGGTFLPLATKKPNQPTSSISHLWKKPNHRHGSWFPDGDSRVGH